VKDEAAISERARKFNQQFKEAEEINGKTSRNIPPKKDYEH